MEDSAAIARLMVPDNFDHFVVVTGRETAFEDLRSRSSAHAISDGLIEAGGMDCGMESLPRYLLVPGGIRTSGAEDVGNITTSPILIRQL